MRIKDLKKIMDIDEDHLIIYDNKDNLFFEGTFNELDDHISSGLIYNYYKIAEIKNSEFCNIFTIYLDCDLSNIAKISAEDDDSFLLITLDRMFELVVEEMQEKESKNN